MSKSNQQTFDNVSILYSYFACKLVAKYRVREVNERVIRRDIKHWRCSWMFITACTML